MSPDGDSQIPIKGFGYWINFGLDIYPALFCLRENKRLFHF